MKKFLLLFALTLTFNAYAADNLILITIDGLRWQEAFNGLDHELAKNKMFSKRSEDIIKQFAGEQSPEKTLLPFIHNTIAKQGVLYGNRDKGECMKVSNPWYFSYPGYNEILTGKADPDINTNGKNLNPNVTFLEWLNGQKKYEGKVVAFASWDVFPYIINEERSGVPVNAGFGTAEGKKLSRFEQLLNILQGDIPSPWKTVRLDAFTHHYALEKIKKDKPKVIYISYGETDDFAHDGHYDQYIFAAHRTDRFISEVWQTLQGIRQYKNNINLIVTVDHGRGSTADDWQHHASKLAMKGYMKKLARFEHGIVGSDDVWFAAMGPDVKAQELISEECLSSNNIAATAVATLGQDWLSFNKQAGKALAILK